MKRKLIILLTLSIMGIGRCGTSCYDPRPDYCGMDGKNATIVFINHHPKIITSQ